MAGSSSISGDRVILTFTFNPLITNGQNIIDLASMRVFNEEADNLWEDLTMQEKLDIVDREIAKHIRSLAESQRNSIGNEMAADSFPIDI